MEQHPSQWEAIQLIKDYTLEHAWFEVEYYLGLTSKSEQTLQRLIDHLSHTFQSCETVSSMIADFYSHSQKAWETKHMFADKLQILVRKIVSHKPEFISKAHQALKHQFIQNLRDSYFRVVARGQYLSSPDSDSFTQFWGQLVLMLNSRGKCTKVATVTSPAVDSGDSEDQLSHISRRRQHKINAQAAEIAAVKAKLNKALEENRKLKSLLSPKKWWRQWLKSSVPWPCRVAQRHQRALNIKVPLIAYAGTDSPSWHVGLMWCWSQIPSASIVRTLDIKRTIISG